MTDNIPAWAREAAERPESASERKYRERLRRRAGLPPLARTPASRLPALKAGPQSKPRPDTAISGTISELLAGADLLRRGYEVFRAFNPHASCDLVALAPDGVLLRIEVRTGKRSQAGRVSCARRPTDRADFYAIVVDGEVLYEPPLDDHRRTDAGRPPDGPGWPESL